MAVITLSRQKGSNGYYIAVKVAELLGYRSVGKDELLELTKEYGVLPRQFEALDEKKPGFLVTQYQDEYIRAMNKIIRQVAQEDNVVMRGRGSEVLTQDFKNALHIRVVAPIELRIERIRNTYKTPYNEAANMVKTSDENRSQYINVFYSVNRRRPFPYDLVINTKYIDVDSAAEYITMIAKSLPGRQEKYEKEMFSFPL
ncbi:MAG: cytidylate kinase-like family protein [Actinobacteria bacterium]|nr:cytidylate kinase-like family protein [Actinomycetota bacterium]